MPSGPVFPAFIRLEHQRDGSAKASFLAEVDALTNDAKVRFDRAFGEIGSIISRSLSAVTKSGLRIDLDTSGLRQAAADAEYSAQRLVAMRDAAVSLARATSDTSAATKTYLSALRAQVIEAERASNEAKNQVTTYERLQAELDKTTSANQRLAQSYRDTFMEQAKAANFAYRSQQAVNAGFAPGLDRQPKSARDSASVFENFGYKPSVDLRSGVDKLLGGSASIDKAALSGATLEQVLGRVAGKSREVAAAVDAQASATARAAQQAAAEAAATQAQVAAMDALRRAEVGAAEGAQILQATYRNTAAALDHQSKSARESAAAFELLFAATEARTSTEAQRFFNTALGIDQTTKSARQSAAVFEEMFAAQERAAAATQELAASAGQLRAQIDPTIALQQRFDAELANADRLLAAGAISTKEYAQAQALARANLASSWQALTASQAENERVAKRGTSETSNVINGIRAQRVAFTQLGQQMQDVVVQTQMGTAATTIFVQQVPQMAFALSGLEGNVNKTYNAIGKVATFMSGPWGAAIFAATAVLAPFIVSLLKTGDATDEAAKKAKEGERSFETLADKLDSTKHSYEEVIKATRDYNAEQAKATQLTLDAAQAAAIQAAKNLDAALAIRKKLAAELDASLANAGPGFATGGRALNYGGTYADQPQQAQAVSDLRGRISANEAAIGSLGKASVHAVGAVATEMAKIATNPRYAIEQRFQRLRNDAVAAGGTVEAVTKRITDLNKQEEAALAAQDRRGGGRSGGGSGSSRSAVDRDAERAAREAAREAEQARKAAEEAAKAYTDIGKEAERRVQIQALTLSGLDAEANALRDIWQYEDQYGKLTEEQKRRIRDVAVAEERVNEVLRTRQEIQNAYLDATRSVRSELENLFAGESVNFGRIFKQLQSRIVVENLFGDIFRDMDKYVRRATGLDDAVDQLVTEGKRAGNAMEQFADAALRVSGRLTSSASVGAIAASSGASVSAFDLAFGGGIDPLKTGDKATNDNAGVGDYSGDIVVVANTMKKAVSEGIRDSRTAMAMSPEAWASMMGRSIGGRLFEELSPLFGPKLAGTLGTVFGGAVGGYAVGGIPGALTGALKDIKGLPDGLTSDLGKAFKGSSTGTMVSGLASAIGVDLNTTGSQVGGAIGSVLPIPGGSIIGSVIGGLIGNLISGVPRGRATVTNDSVSASGNRGGIIEGLNAQGGSIQSGISAVAKQLGATVGQYAVGIGSYKGKYYQVSSSANDPYLGKAQYSAKSSQAVYDGTDATAALKAAIGVAIQQGAIQGIRASTQTLLKAGKDIEQQVDKALKFEGVFKTLKSYIDPVGAALDTLNTNFKELKSIFDEAGASAAEYADLEKLYSIERTKVVEEETQRLTGTLKSFLDDLKTGDNGLSLRDRRAAILTEFDPLKARVQAGDTTAYDKYAEVGRSLLDIERQLYGSQAEYFARFNELTAISQSALDQNYAKINAATASDSPFSSKGTTDVTSAITTQTDTLSSQLGAVNDNLGTLIAQNQAAAQSNNAIDLSWLNSSNYW